MAASYIEKYRAEFSNSPQVSAFAPGRINFIGEHTDYNLGYVLPAAIDRKIHFLAAARTDDKVIIRGEDFQETRTFRLDEGPDTRTGSWIDYVKGIFWVLQSEGFHLSGVDGYICGDVPLQAGLSSSAALEISILSGLNELFGLRIPPMQMAKWGQRAENEFVGVQCGLMDQFIAVFGKVDHAVFLDCQTLAYKEVPASLQGQGLQLVVFDSKVKRELAGSEYNIRRSQSQSALEALEKWGVSCFRDLDKTGLEKIRNDMAELPFKRAHHVVTENARVLQAVDALADGNFSELGELLFRSHESLRDYYEVSCAELDLLYDCGRSFPGCLGARMIGAGFGGSGIALLKSQEKQAFKDVVLHAAERMGFPQPEFYDIEIGSGARAVRLDGDSS